MVVRARDMRRMRRRSRSTPLPRGRGLYRTAYLLAGSHADAEDLAQQTGRPSAPHKVSRADHPAAYLRRMMTNLYISGRRPKSRRFELLTDTHRSRERAARGTDRLEL